MKPVSYERRISSEEAREGYVLVEKARLKLFPAVGKSFQLNIDGQARRSKVEAYDCTCRGPQKPHEHWFVRWPGVKQGQIVCITLPALE